MYYPYLRAKQFELKALREFSAENKNQKSIIPILEPVKQQTNALNLAIDEMMANGLKFALILNPGNGDFKHKTVAFDEWTQNEQLKNNRKSWIPAFIYSQNAAPAIEKLINDYQLAEVMVIFAEGYDMDDIESENLINQVPIEYIVNSFGSMVSGRVKKHLRETGKKIIRLDDCFRSRTRNADYADNVDELFTEVPFFYDTEENLAGYSDYAVMPSEYVEGGMLPYALAIHLSYRKNEDQINVHHFVSDSNESNNDTRRKFREAAVKVAPFYNGRDKTSAVSEIIERANSSDGYPGLGYLKKLSLKNHLELILSL